MLRRRVSRTLPPYVVWSLAYAVILQRSGPLGALKAVLTAGAAAQLYFVAVYLQLVILTPLLYRMLKRCRGLVYAITPICLLVYEVATAAGFAFPALCRLFPVWLVYYVVGLDWPHWSKVLEGRLRLVCCAFVVCLAVQFAAGYGWNAMGNYNMATTQLKLSSMFTSLCVIALLILLPCFVRRGAASSFLVPLGDASFGIYLCHIFAIVIFRRMLALAALPLTLSTILLWLLALGVSFAVCSLGTLFLPRSASKVIGLV